MGRTKFPPPLYSTGRSDRTRPPAAGQITPNVSAIDAVALYFSRLGAPMYAHERTTLSIVAESIARLNGYGYLGVFDAKEHSTERVFFVPDDTLMLDEAQALGVHSPHQLYGAATPYPFAKTKAITHRLVNEHAERPSGWSSGFADSVRNAVLPGYTAFSSDDARTAATRLLPLGSVRAKEPPGDGGHGQTVITRRPIP